MTEDRMPTTQDSIFGALDDQDLPELPDPVWMRLLANALDPDAPPADAALIPVDLPADPSSTDDFGPVDDGAGSGGVDDAFDDAGSDDDDLDGGGDDGSGSAADFGAGADWSDGFGHVTGPDQDPYAGSGE